MRSQSIIVSGASGWLGSEIAQSITNGTVLCLHRVRPRGNTSHPALTGDLRDSKNIDQLVEQYRKLIIEADAFIHCAGLAHQPNETPEIKEAMWQVNDIGTANALEFCQRVGIKKFVYISTIAGYDWTSGCAINEDSTLVPKSEYAKSKLAGEERVRTASLDGRIIRLATVYGSGDQANFSRLSASLQKRRFPVPGNGSALKSVIPIDMAASLIVKFAAMNEVPYQIINLALPEAPSLSEICDTFSHNCNFAPAPRIPLTAMRILARIGDCIDHIRKAPFSSEVLQKLTTSTWVDTSRMQETFPDELFEDFNSGLKRHADYYRNLQ